MNKEQLLEHGISKTVYALVYPEVREVLTNLFADPKFQDHFEEAYTNKQDKIHKEFFTTYLNWTSSILKFNPSDFYTYPSNGSSEAIREVIAYHSSSQRIHGKVPRIHVFAGEYEGYDAYAAAHGVQLIKHNRYIFDKTLKMDVLEDDLFFISQPSAIDGNLWNDFEDFIIWCNNNIPSLRIMVDFAYLGTIPFSIPKINLNYPNISTIFISLSKSFGLYYYRVGGVFSKIELPGLYGNCWFKSIPALIAGTTLMNKFHITTLPSRYEHIKDEIINNLRQKFGKDIDFSDSLLIASQHARLNHPLRDALQREHLIRYCITPGMDKLIKNKK